jgi:hypothetical protein
MARVISYIPENIKPSFMLAPYHGATAILRNVPANGRLIGLHKGQVGLADMALAAADRAGDARVLIHSWGISCEDLALLQLAKKTGRVRDIEIRLDSCREKGDRFAAAKAAFGADNVTAASLHAEWASVEGDKESFAIRGSMGMSRNTQIQQFDIDASAEFCATLRNEHANPQKKAAYPNKAKEADLARAALSKLTPKGRLFICPRGFSLPALVHAALDLTGPAEVSVITWSSDAKTADALRAHPNARSVHAVLGTGYVSLPHNDSADVIRTIPETRVARSHSKVISIQNENWNLAPNPRAEQVDIDDNAAIAAFFAAFTKEAFERIPAAARGNAGPIARHFERCLSGGIDKAAYRTEHKGPLPALDMQLYGSPKVPIDFSRYDPKPLDLSRYDAPKEPIKFQLLLPL